jgi:hypothetical protein
MPKEVQLLEQHQESPGLSAHLMLRHYLCIIQVLMQTIMQVLIQHIPVLTQHN